MGRKIERDPNCIRPQLGGRKVQQKLPEGRCLHVCLNKDDTVRSYGSLRMILRLQDRWKMVAGAVCSEGAGDGGKRLVAGTSIVALAI